MMIDTFRQGQLELLESQAILHETGQDRIDLRCSRCSSMHAVICSLNDNDCRELYCAACWREKQAAEERHQAALEEQFFARLDSESLEAWLGSEPDEKEQGR